MRILNLLRLVTYLPLASALASRPSFTRATTGTVLSAMTQVRGGDVESSTTAELPRMKFYCLDGGMCPYAARTWITLVELGYPFEIGYVNQTSIKSDWYLQLNPKGKVPVVHNLENDCVVYESAICDEYLCDVANQVQPLLDNTLSFWNLRPTCASQTANMRLLNDHVDTKVNPAAYTYLMNKDSDKDDELKQALETALGELETSIQSTGGPFLMGSHFTLADAHLLPFFLRLKVSLVHFKAFELSADKFSHLLAWFDECSKRPSAQATAKTNDKIIEVYSKFVSMDYAFGGLNQNKKT